MKILAMSQEQFVNVLTRKEVTDDNVEESTRLAFICIHDTGQSDTYFKSNHANVTNLWFDDILEDIIETDPETGVVIRAYNAMNYEQAEHLYAFIKANLDKAAILVHCAAGISRSGAVGCFLYDLTAGPKNGADMDYFFKNNPHIQPNEHVYDQLNRAYYKDSSQF